MTENARKRDVTYRCVVGHAVPASDLEARTVLVRLDRGTEVRICREHGAPIAMSSHPTNSMPDGEPQVADT